MDNNLDNSSLRFLVAPFRVVPLRPCLRRLFRIRVHPCPSAVQFFSAFALVDFCFLLSQFQLLLCDFSF
jgi:hypothetical protein